MNRKVLLLLGLLLLTILSPITVPCAEATAPTKLYALIISGSEGLSFSNNAQYLYHVLNQHYLFDGIYYLDIYTDRPGVNALSNKTNVRSAITNWLASQSDINDITFIYFASHGGGYHITEGLASGRVETGASDEGNEVSENNFRVANLLPPHDVSPWPLNTRVDWDRDGNRDDRIRDFNSDNFIEVDVNDNGDINWIYDHWLDLDGDGVYDDLFADVGTHDRCNILIDADTNGDEIIDNWISDGEDANNDGYIVGVDFNGDGDLNDWVGIDECLQVQDGWYWDDELKNDLSRVRGRIIFVRQGCVEGNLSCFGGGLIDDISSSNRIIMSATNETQYSYGDFDDQGDPGYGYSEWSEAFIDALHGERTYYNATTHEVVHIPGMKVNADLDNNGHVSMWEAWTYAWNNDEARLSGDETPWLDDDGNRLPTYKNEADQLDNDDGQLASQTILQSGQPVDLSVVSVISVPPHYDVVEVYKGDMRWNGTHVTMNCSLK